MRGLMMETPLLISSIITHAARHHGAAEIVSRTVEGPCHHYTYRDAERRIKQLVNALVALGPGTGRPGCNAGLEWLSASRTVPRDFQPWRGVSHDQSAVVQEPDRVHR